MQLREYQQQAIEAILDNYKKGINKQVAVLATGLGKTVIFSHLVSRRILQTKKKALIIAHREELLLQAKEKLLRVNPDLKIGIEQAVQTADHASDEVVIASVATIGRAGSERLLQFNPVEYSTIIIDEAHHASATTYKNILRHFGVLKNENNWNRNILLLGVTATPKRNDNHGIEQIFDEVSFEYSILDGIKQRWLINIRAVKVNTTVDINSVGTASGDFVISELEQIINTPERNALIVKTYQDIANGKQALIFAVDVEHTKALTEAFRDAGISAAYITGETEKEKRRELLNKYARKDINVMVNALVLTEGYDNASIAYVLMARPTQSGILYHQMIGRGTRLSENKDYLMIVDFVDNTSKHSLQTAATLLGLDGAVDFNGQDILGMQAKIDRLLEKRPYYNLNKLDVTNIEYLLKEVEVLESKKEIEQKETYKWHTYGDTMRMHNGKYKDLLVEHTLTGQYALYEYIILANTKRKLGEFITKSEAMKFADTMVVQNYTGLNNQTNVDMPWRNDIPSEAQIALLRTLGVSEQRILFLTKGEASKMISEIKRRR